MEPNLKPEPPVLERQGEDLYRIAVAMIELTRRCQERDKPVVEMFPSPLSAMTYGTIRLTGPRLCGHTSAALRLVVDYFGNNAAFVTPPGQGVEVLRKYVRKTVKFLPRHVLHVGDSLEKWQGRSLDAVVVDGASRIGAAVLPRLYDGVILDCFSATRHGPLYILIG
jgi:hypothetical protein